MGITQGMEEVRGEEEERMVYSGQYYKQYNQM